MYAEVLHYFPQHNFCNLINSRFKPSFKAITYDSTFILRLEHMARSITNLSNVKNKTLYKFNNQCISAENLPGSFQIFERELQILSSSSLPRSVSQAEKNSLKLAKNINMEEVAKVQQQTTRTRNLRTQSKMKTVYRRK